MKKEIIKQKEFLRKIFKRKNIDSLLNKASDEELNATIYAINFVATKKVPLPEEVSKQISQIKRQALNRFQATFHEKFENLIEGKRNKKIKTLGFYEPIIKKYLAAYFSNKKDGIFKR